MIQTKEKSVTKRNVPMWLIHDSLYHYSDEQRARWKEDGKETARLVWVGVDNSYFIGTVQPSEWFNGWIFDTQVEAEAEIIKYNELLEEYK